MSEIKPQKTIVFTGGGSAGHVVPNLVLMDVLAKKGWNMAYIGSKEGIEKKLTEKTKVPYHGIYSGKLRRYWSIQNFVDPFKVLAGSMEAWHILGKIKPDVVFSKGGFIACPVVFAAWLRRIPVIVHESDLTPGLANRLNFPLASKIALTFEQTKQAVSCKKKVVVTGTPVRQALLQGDAAAGRSLCGFNHAKPCIMIMGGGSGAASINEIVRKALPELLPEFNVIHLCGQGKMDTRLSTLEGYKQFDYVNEDLAHLYACSDLVISRAGANSVYEILALKKPHIFIPLSTKASRGDQIANARFFESLGLSVVLEEASLNAEILVQEINEIFSRLETIQEKIKAYSSETASGAEAIVNLIEVTCG